ncbi:MAG: hypothetical protein IPJ25_14670 [Rhodocyclaceae bacterium]|nr:hypothetical protein [Rhodocyclaceae bacterium]MBL0074836.1 hypothetical protein [Rhodocyclaceae bacterium]MBP6110394.1 hypothetical protein [Rhodocyclaceae bacterium]
MAKVGSSVRKAIEDWSSGDFDFAMLHACNAVDGTASKLHPKDGSNKRFTQTLRDNYAIVGPMAAPGIDLVNTRWPVNVPRPKAPGGQADFADVIYGIHRCSHGHGSELPDGFELLPDATRLDGVTRIHVEKGKVRLSDRVIFGLLAVAVLSSANADQRVPDGYFLTLGGTKLLINDWWGRAVDFLPLAATEPLPNVLLDFGDWMIDIK